MEVLGPILAIIFFIFAVVSCDASHDKKVEYEASLMKKDTENRNLKDKYNTLSCKMRGLLVEEVEGIKLCMNPETRALHKIDEVKDSK